MNAANRLLQTDLALCKFHRDHGRYSGELRDLAPDYLPRALTDPYSGQGFRYQRDEEGFKLYSAGWDGVDDGGKLVDSTAYEQVRVNNESGLDYDLDAFTRP